MTQNAHAVCPKCGAMDESKAELLAVLEGFVQRVEGLKSRLRRPLWLDASLTEAKAAIAKAEGR